MKSAVRVCAGVVLLVAVCGGCSRPMFLGGDDVIPYQARPAAELIKAVKNSDLALLKTVFSKRMVGRFEAIGWEKTLEDYRHAFSREFTDYDFTDYGFAEYDFSDFQFSYDGDDQRGSAIIVYKGKEYPMRVIKEGEAWKLDER